ncbi:MAG: hypothetical protein PHH91_05510 [Desulfuromonadaceae bacterium]|nr:hypothetical protein [Desulfuromonadaceae bacterium]
MMPVIDGLEALQVIHSIEKRMKIPPALTANIVMTSALNDPHTVIKALNEGEATSFIVKPITRLRLATSRCWSSYPSGTSRSNLLASTTRCGNCTLPDSAGASSRHHWWRRSSFPPGHSCSSSRSCRGRSS